MEKENGGFFNPTIKKFWNCLYQEAVDLKQCEKYIVDAIALVSDEFGLVKVEMWCFMSYGTRNRQITDGTSWKSFCGTYFSGMTEI